MKTGIIILIGLLILSVGEASGQNWRKISKEIRDKQLLITPKSYTVTFHYDLRKKSHVLNKMKLIHTQDTIFILQIHDVINPCILHSMVWNQIDTLSIVSKDCGKIYQIGNLLFESKYKMKLISEWNLDEIKRAEAAYYVLSDSWYFITRIIFKGKKYEIDCFRYSDFYNKKVEDFEF